MPVFRIELRGDDQEKSWSRHHSVLEVGDLLVGIVEYVPTGFTIGKMKRATNTYENERPGVADCSETSSHGWSRSDAIHMPRLDARANWGYKLHELRFVLLSFSVYDWHVWQFL